MLKKTITLLVILVLVALCACAKNTNNTDANSEPKSNPSAFDVSEENGKDIAAIETDNGSNVMDVSVSLEKLGEIEDAGFDPEDINVYDRDTKKYTICDYTGENVLNDSVDEIEYVLGSDRLFVVTKEDKMPNGVGLVGGDGTVYIDCSAAVIEKMTDRFFEVYYADKEVKTPDEALFYWQGHSFAVNSMQPQEGDLLYAGRKMIFDIEAKAFVPDIVISDRNSNFEIVHSNAIALTDSYQHIMEIYDANGQTVAMPNAEMRMIGEYLYYREDDWRHIYDGDGNKLFSTILDVDKVFDENFFDVMADGGYRLYDRNENPVSDIVFNSTPNYNGSLFWGHKKGKGSYGCIDSSGNIIVNFNAENISASESKDYLIVENGNKKSYVLANGTVVTDKDLSSKMSEIDWINDSVVTDRDESTHLYTVYAFPSCEKLLSAQYYNVKNPKFSNLLYCKTEDAKWEVYRIAVK